MQRVWFTGTSLAALVHAQQRSGAVDPAAVFHRGIVFGNFLTETDLKGLQISLLKDNIDRPLALDSSPRLPPIPYPILEEYRAHTYGVQFNSLAWNSLTEATQRAGYAKEKVYARDALRCFLAALDTQYNGGAIIVTTPSGRVGTVIFESIFD